MVFPALNHTSVWLGKHSINSHWLNYMNEWMNEWMNRLRACQVASVTSDSLTLQSMDCSLPGSSVHGILQARILEWVAISFSRQSSRLRDQTRVSYFSWTVTVRSLYLKILFHSFVVVFQSLNYFWFFAAPWTAARHALSWRTLSPRVCSNSCLLSQWCHSTISSFAAPIASGLQSSPVLGSFPASWCFA